MPDTLDIIRRLRAEEGPPPEPIPEQPDIQFFQSTPDYDWMGEGGVRLRDEGGRGPRMEPEDRPEPPPLQWIPEYEGEFEELMRRNPIAYHRPTYAEPTNYDEFARKQFLGGKQKEADEKRRWDEWNRTLNKEQMAPWRERQLELLDLDEARTANELILGQMERESKARKEDIQEARREEAIRIPRGIGSWDKIIGPPGVQTKPSKIFPGKPPSDDELSDLQDFDKFWNFIVQQNYGGQDPLKINPSDAREEAETAIRDMNAQFLYDYETYGHLQKDPTATFKYKKLTTAIKEAGDRAEKSAEKLREMAKGDRATTMKVYEEHKKELKEKEKVIEEHGPKGKWKPQDKRKYDNAVSALRSLEQAQATGNIMNEKKFNQLKTKYETTMWDIEKEYMSRPISEGLRYMKGTTDPDEIRRKADILASPPYNWTKDELIQLKKAMGY
jgi:hypothetical protein